MKHNNTHTILSLQQQEVLRQILPIASIATSGAVGNLPVRPRTHTLLVGPSGAGKSHIAREIDGMLGISTLVVNVSSWVVLSAKNEPWTYSEICSWLDSIGSGGGILVLDEIDKLTSEGDSTWLGHIILEIHDLIDGNHIPPPQFKRAIRDYPGLLLKHQGKRIPVDLLMRCVRFEPFDAFVIRKRFPPALHAKILAETCVLPFQLFNSGNISRLPAEIETSFRRNPVEWIEVHNRDFSKLFRVLERHGRIKTCQNLLNILMSSLPQEHLPGLFKFITNQL